MRKYLFPLLLISLAINVKGQIIDTLYYDASWRLVPLGSGEFFRIAKIDTANLKFIGRAKDYLQSGVLILAGNYNIDGQKHGRFKRYYDSGKIYSEGEYINDRLSGIWHYYDESGSLYERINFKTKYFSIEEYYDKEGHHLVEDGTGKWEKVFQDRQGYLILTAFFNNGQRVNTWTVKDPKGRIIIKEFYKNGQMQKGMDTGSSSKKYRESKFQNDIFYAASFGNIESFKLSNCTKADYPYIDGLPDKSYEELFQIVENPASYPGGVAAFYQFIQKNMKYPAEAQRMGLEGKVFVEFVIDQEGNITDVKVLRGIGGGCDQEAVRVIKNSGRWISGEQRGKKVRQRMVLPITFSLN